MKVKLLTEEAKAPTIAYETAAGFDIYSPCTFGIYPGMRHQQKLCIAIEIRDDEVVIMSERSGMAINKGITSIGNIIDSDYRGEISIILLNSSKEEVVFEKGDKIGQIVVVKLGERKVEVVEELSETERGEKAHGSSGK